MAKKKKKPPARSVPRQPETLSSLVQWAAKVPRPRLFFSALAGAIALILYIVTLAPDVLAHDSGEWQAAAATLGIPHSPGSPAYMLLGYLFTLAPLGTAAARVSFLSAVVGAAGVAALFYFMLLLLDRWLPAVVSAASLALAGLWWSHASVATPYNAVPTVITFAFIFLLLWRSKGDVRLIWGMAFMLAFGISYHPSLVYFLPVAAGGVFFLGPWKKLIRPRHLLLTALFFFLGLSFYLYLPLRSAAEPSVLYTKIDSLSVFVDYVSASEARETGHGALTLPDPAEIRDQFLQVVRDGYYPSYAFLVFGPAVVLFHPAAWRAMRQRGRILAFLLAAIVVHTATILAFSSIYAQYYMPLILYFSIWAGFSVYLYTIAAEALDIGRYALVPVTLLAAIYFTFLGLGIPRVWPLVNHGNDVAMRLYLESSFRVAEQDAIVLANWESYTAFQYAQAVDGERTDLRVISVPEAGWAEFVPQASDIGPPQVLLSHTAPFDRRDAGLIERQYSQYFVSIKGRTYQNRDHGEPYPAAIELYEVRY